MTPPLSRAELRQRLAYNDFDHTQQHETTVAIFIVHCEGFVPEHSAAVSGREVIILWWKHLKTRSRLLYFLWNTIHCNIALALTPV